jgi:hypothetical protein
MAATDGEKSLPSLNRRPTNFLYCTVGYRTFPIRKENHDRRSVQGGSIKKQNRINSGLDNEPFCAPVLKHNDLGGTES